MYINLKVTCDKFKKQLTVIFIAQNIIAFLFEDNPGLEHFIRKQQFGFRFVQIATVYNRQPQRFGKFFVML